MFGFSRRKSNSELRNNPNNDGLGNDYSNQNLFGFGNGVPQRNVLQKPEGMLYALIDNEISEIEPILRGEKTIVKVVEENGRKKSKTMIVKKKLHYLSEERIESALGFVKALLSTGIKLSRINKERFDVYMAGGKRSIGVHQKVINYFFWIAINETPRFKYFIDGINKPYPDGSILDDLTIESLMREVMDLASIICFRVEALFSRAVEGRENSNVYDSAPNQHSLNKSGDPFFPQF
ncbi:MAG: hypothetical protein IMZ60_02490 [Actinobacteria bacterium]|nr:hypothetical protein [Actinomycetota bacterium]